MELVNVVEVDGLDEIYSKSRGLNRKREFMVEKNVSPRANSRLLTK